MQPENYVDMSDLVRATWETGQDIDLSGIGYGRIHWGNKTDIKDTPTPYYPFLAGVVKHFGFTRILEIGTHWGGATKAMWHGIQSKDGAKVVTVDITAESDGKLDNYPQIHKIVGDANSEKTFREVVSAFSGGPIDLLYVDAAHLTAPTFTSYALFGAALQPKLMIFDDITLNEPMREAWRLITRWAPEGRAINAAEVVGAIRPTGDGFGVVRPSYRETTAAKTVFVHINKCGGSAVKQAIRDSAPNGRVCDFIFSGEYESYGYEKASQDFDIFMSHIGVDDARKLGNKFVTVLRDPIERLISLYNFWHLRSPNVDPAGVFAEVANMSFEDFLRSDDQRIIVSRQNTITYQLAGSHEYPRRSKLDVLGDNEVLRMARENLSQFSAVGVLEKPSSLIPIIGHDKMKTVNKTAREFTPDLSDKTTRDLVFASIYLDQQVYADALRML